jgi:cell division protein FtsQ
MPAIVRGGKRQTSSGAAARAPAAPARATRGSARAKKTAPKRSVMVVGSVPLPNELVAWLAFLLILGLMMLALMTGGRAQKLGQTITGFTDARLAQIGVSLQNVRLNGASSAAQNDIKRALLNLELKRDKPLALMDLKGVRAEVEKVGWVKSATVRRQLPSSLIIDVVERPRLAIWQYQNQNFVIDDMGQIIPEARPGDFVDLPLVAGEGANERADEMLQMLRTHPQVSSRLWALVRVDTRRWDLHFKNKTIVKLPALDEEAALTQLDRMIRDHRVLDQGLASIDLRNPSAMTVVPFEPKP